MGMQRVAKIISERDGISMVEAMELVSETKDEVMESIGNGSLFEAEDIIMDNLGLEPDYLDDLVDMY